MSVDRGVRPHPRLNHPDAGLPDHDDDRAWDLLVVGAGAAGLVGARTAAGLGARVLLVEQDRTGGDCLFTGCVPSKALIAAADAAATARSAHRLGVGVGDVAVDFEAVMAHVQRAVERVAPVDSPAALREAGVSVVGGTVRFTGPETAAVDGRPVRFAQALLCTGATPTQPPVPGLAEADPLTSESVWTLRERPRELLVVGGGSVGCELAQAFARLGSRVTLVEPAPTVLPLEEAECSSVVEAALGRDGVRVLTGTEVASVSPAGAAPGGRASLSHGVAVDFDRVLVAVGRTPRTADLGLAAAGVAVESDARVRVDAHLRTSNPRIWAAGDLTGHPQLTHTAGVHASVAATNAVLGVRRRAALGQPRVTYTQPEVAAVGVAPSEAARGQRVVRWSHEHVDRAVAEDRTAGSTTLVLDRRGRLVGASVIGPRAGETLGELGLAVAQGVTAGDLVGVTHAYPTWNDGVWNAAIDDYWARLRRPVPSRALRAAAAARRGWLRRSSTAE